MDELALIKTIAAAFTFAWIFGLLAQKLHLSPVLGYLLAGIVIGPHTPGFTGDLEIAHQLAELGVILLMFGVGLHFPLHELLAVRKVAIPGAILESGLAIVAGLLIYGFLGYPVLTCAVIGMCIAVASTVVLTRALSDTNTLDSPAGRIAIGWLIVEDFFTVVLLVLIPLMATTVPTMVNGAALTSGGGASVFWTVCYALAKLAVFVALVLLVGSRIIPGVLARVARLRSRELFTLTVLVFSIAIATAAYVIFGASMALGALLAGIVVSQSPVSHQAAADALPLRDAFAVLFFVSVGMLFDPIALWNDPGLVLAALGIILVWKPIMAFGIVLFLGQSVRTALTVALGLAQIAEFTFVLSELSVRYALMPETIRHSLVGASIISIALHPWLMRSVPQIEAWLQRRTRLWQWLNRRADQRAGELNAMTRESVRVNLSQGKRHAVVIGFGPVGRSVHRLLKDAGLSTVVVDANFDTIASLQADGQLAIFGDASQESILEQAGVAGASHVILTLPNRNQRAAIVTMVRNLNPRSRIYVRARYLQEREELERSGATAAVFEEAEAAVALARLVLVDAGLHGAAAKRKVRDLRMQLILENMSQIRTQRVRTIMVPWVRVRRLFTTTPRQEVLARIAHERFSRWPVVDSSTRSVVGYLLAKDLIAQSTSEQWQSLIRPIATVQPDDEIEAVLARMQHDNVTLFVVMDRDQPMGLITQEDILEQVVGRIEDEYPHQPVITLRDASYSGAILMDLRGSSGEQVIRELVSAIPDDALPPGATHQQVAEWVLQREQEVSTDLGLGVAIPHARCPQLHHAVLVFGRSETGVMFSSEFTALVRLVFLLLTPGDQPEVQLSLLRQIAMLAEDETRRDRLLAASDRAEIEDVLCE